MGGMKEERMEKEIRVQSCRVCTRLDCACLYMCVQAHVLLTAPAVDYSRRPTASKEADKFAHGPHVELT